MDASDDMDDLHDLADSVVDEKSFVAFLRALSDDRAREVEMEKAAPSPPYCPGALGWENGSIEAFLEAAAAGAATEGSWVEEDGTPLNPWTRCAQILLLGKYYE
jgi:hypothetical protein